MTSDKSETENSSHTNIPQCNFKSPFVEKPEPIEIDEGCLLAVDSANIIEFMKDVDHDDFLKSLSRDNAQLLINKLWQLPTELVETVVVATLPTRTTVLPREKPVPKAKPLTKWQEYAKTKGIQHRKKEKMVWDENAKEFRPRWGYKKANDDSANNWAIELPASGDISEDIFDKIKEKKKEKVAKNELQRLRNVARAHNLKIPYQPVANAQQGTSQLTKAFHEATKATASVGKFVDKVRNEPKDLRTGKKRKFESNLLDSKTEHKRQMQILKEMTADKSVLNTEKAARRQMQEEEREKRMSKVEKPKKGTKPRRAWLPPDKYEKSKKIEAKREAKREALGKPTKASKVAAKGKSKGPKGMGGKGGSKTRKMMKRAK